MIYRTQYQSDSNLKINQSNLMVLENQYSKPKKIQKERANIQNITRPPKNQILTFYNMTVVTVWREEKNKMK